MDSARPLAATDGASLAAEVERLRSTLDQVGAYVFTKDREGRYTYANRMVCALFGVELEALLGKTDEAFFDLRTSDDLRSNDRRVLDQGERIEGEERNYLAGSGELRIYWTVKLPLFDAAGQVSGMCGISTDITERRRIEDTLREQRLLLDTVLNNVDAYVYMKDREHRYLYVNPKTAALFGRPVSEVVGRSDAELLPISVADGFAVLDRDVFARGEKSEGEETFRSEHGELHHYWTTKIPLRRNDEVYALIGISTDITPLHKVTEEFRRLANSDALTGTLSRRYFLECGEEYFRRSRTDGQALTAIAIDIDHFKDINDRFGHAAGDRVLQAVSDCCRQVLRPSDLFGRLGGDELSILLVGSAGGAQRVAERLREAIARCPATLEQAASAAVSASLGVATTDEHTVSLQALLKQADEALYLAKRDGRNRIHVYRS